MPLVGRPAPHFDMLSTKNMETLAERVQLSDYRGKWLILFFYPGDFTFVCPTEVMAFNERIQEFHDLDAEVLGVSTDSVHSHKAWIQLPRTQNGLGGLNYPLASDFTKRVSRSYEVLDEETGTAMRGLFIIDPDGTVMYQVLHNNDVGRSVDETLRVLEALQAGGMCAANWKPGDKTLSV
ncbi:peroxiredoxin [Alicyclobacillus hesperidum]|uniref:Peroxiredoxin n=1 Tax=Alicyclobacillus hesperidum TaxID=89784 RepID=A0A1H2RP49_9BACL|nr:peroxiredoxin [Alicyclobacillus hesperidum]GLV13535.1 peroxiredoxin [Alicyclobacillus hesperidum]SDW20950.1 peroxiredoxin (alkyl hydroperoxide reductase subunit C) [Alicyclobacillus hesperidum]